jgi:hypothetical protein
MRRWDHVDGCGAFVSALCIRYPLYYWHLAVAVSLFVFVCGSGWLCGIARAVCIRYLIQN